MTLVRQIRIKYEKNYLEAKFIVTKKFERVDEF